MLSDIASVISLIGYLALITLAVASIGRALSAQPPVKRPVRYHGRSDYPTPGYFNDPS